MNLLRHLESNQSEVKHDLEKSIDSIKAQREKHEQEYAKNLNILSSVSDNLLNILKNVAVDEAALDQQLLSTGISDRNLEEYLGLVEQRIDELIQVSYFLYNYFLLLTITYFFFLSFFRCQRLLLIKIYVVMILFV